MVRPHTASYPGVAAALAARSMLQEMRSMQATAVVVRDDGVVRTPAPTPAIGTS